jgi:HAD superfamily hydrolase (TIGR01458 family)
MKSKIDQNSTFLIDVDGVLLLSEKAIDGAPEAIDFLNQNEIGYLIVTNFTRLSKNVLLERLNNAGFNIPENRIFTPVIAASEYIKSKSKNPKVFLIGPQTLEDELHEYGLEVTRNEEDVEFVVLGFDKSTNYEMLNKAFRLINAGKEFIALHSYRQHPEKDGMVMSLGCFVKGLEYCTKKEPIIIGKPNRNFFEMALKIVGTKPESTYMIGDDPESDIKGARDSGLKSILVKTGTYNVNDQIKDEQKPDFIVDSIKNLPDLFKE